MRNTARIFGNIIGAPEPESPAHYMNVAMQATLLPGIVKFMNTPSPLSAMLARERN